MGSGSIKRDAVLVGMLLQRDLDVWSMGFKRKSARIDLGQPEWAFSDDELDQSLFLRGNLQLSYRILNAKHSLHERFPITTRTSHVFYTMIRANL